MSGMLMTSSCWGTSELRPRLPSSTCRLSTRQKLNNYLKRQSRQLKVSVKSVNQVLWLNDSYCVKLISLDMWYDLWDYIEVSHHLCNIYNIIVCSKDNWETERSRIIHSWRWRWHTRNKNGGLICWSRRGWSGEMEVGRGRREGSDSGDGSDKEP